MLAIAASIKLFLVELLLMRLLSCILVSTLMEESTLIMKWLQLLSWYVSRTSLSLNRTVVSFKVKNSNLFA